MTENLKHPQLYSPVAGTVDERAVLLVNQCSTCDHISFPRQDYGCEKCGAFGDTQAPVEIAAIGVLQSYATVHRHPGKDIEAPFVIGEVRLDDGPTIRITMREANDEALQIGARVVGVFQSVPQVGADAPGPPNQNELRFTLEAKT